MSLEFEDKYGVLMNQSHYGEKVSPLTSFSIRHHLARDENDFNKKLIVVAIAFFAAAIGVLFWYIHDTITPKPVKYNFSSQVMKSLPKETELQILK